MNYDAIIIGAGHNGLVGSAIMRALERKGFSPASRKALKRLWHILRNPKLNTSQAVDQIRDELGSQEE